MDESMSREKYFILLEETTGYILVRDVFKASKKVWKEKLQRGTILEEQSSDDPHTKTFVVASDRRADCKDVHFDCDAFDCSANKLMITNGEAQRLLKIASPEERYQSFRESERSAEEQHELEPNEVRDLGKEEKEGFSSNPLSYDYRTSGNQPGAQLTQKDQQVENAKRQLRELEQQLREKDQQQKNAQRQLREMEQQLKEKDQQQENAQRKLREMEQQLREKDQQQENAQRKLREMEQQLREKDQQQENAQRKLREMEQQLENLQERLSWEKGEETDTLLQQVTTLEGQLRAKNQKVIEHEITLDAVLNCPPDWVIPGDQIQLTDKRLGKGAWGRVVEGKYCGCAVAVKDINEFVLSPHNRRVFEREMSIASRCRHPCLLQFIGATNDEGSPLFVTELMETSLRALLQKRSLSATEVSIISLDVARALNYLHRKKPSPIIHRDISSANVLLWRQGDQWRGKVSDYGTARLMQQTMTPSPGIYSAPEALKERNQTVKIDVYSFGVLLCEMCIRELPVPEIRDQQVDMVTNRLLRALIRGCLQSEPAKRPTMEEIIEELEKPA